MQTFKASDEPAHGGRDAGLPADGARLAAVANSRATRFAWPSGAICKTGAGPLSLCYDGHMAKIKVPGWRGWTSFGNCHARNSLAGRLRARTAKLHAAQTLAIGLEPSTNLRPIRRRQREVQTNFSSKHLAFLGLCEGRDCQREQLRE